MQDDKAKKSEYDRESYAFWKSLNRCVTCHEQDAYTLAGRVRCAECTAKYSELRKSYRERNKERVYAKQRDWYSLMKAEKRCVRCGKPVEGKHVICAGCRAKRRASYAERSSAGGKIAKRQASDLGICGVCNKRPATAGRRTCPECYENSMRNLEKANNAYDNSMHPWRRMAHAEAERRAAG